MIRDIRRASSGLSSEPAARRVWIDFETFYGTKYSLRSNKINYTEYVRDPRFAIMCVSVETDDGEELELDAAQFHNWMLSKTAQWWSESDVFAHNMMFDGLILSEKYDVRPRRWYCTLALVRALFQGGINADLDSVCGFLGLPLKPPTLIKMRDKRWEDLTPTEQQEAKEYCHHDVRSCRKITELLFDALPPEEKELMHMTLQQFLEPKLYIDESLLRQEIADVQAERTRLIEASGVQPLGRKTAEDRLRSTPMFADLLREHGIEPPTKWSEKQEKDVEVFSKTHLPWLRLVEEWRREGREELVRLADARMNCASSIHITRPQRLLTLSNNGCPIGAAYNYYGAHTGRWSGANKLNKQNFKRGSALRRSIVAPKGYVLVVGDASQIELRFNSWLHNELRVLNLLRVGKCAYRRMGGRIYNLTEEEADALHKDDMRRFVGKVAILGLGFGMSGPKFNDTLALGSMGPAVFLSQEETNHIVYGVYRPENPNIVQGWRFLNDLLYRMMTPGFSFTWKCLEFKHNRVILPNGMTLEYSGLRSPEEGKVEYFADNDWNKIYGGLFDENIVQALARIPIGDAQRRIRREMPIVLHTHDEVVALVKEQEADDALKFLLSELSVPPSWAPDIPLKAEGGYDYCYSK